MIKMYPSYINPDVKSRAERKLYEVIKTSGNSEFVCLHSLGLARHMWKKQGEIDFVLIGDGFILCLEVKGGRIKRRDGIWYFTDRYGQESKKTEGPFSQAMSGMFSLKTNIESKFGRTGLIFGYGVLMPDIDFKEASPEWEPETLYDLKDVSLPFEKYIDRLKTFWKQKVGTPSTRVDIKEVIKYLRGDFEIAIPLWKEIQETESEMANFSDEQYGALDHMENNPRLIFTGGAGSGKTLLAVEKARRASLSGKSVLLLCYNKFLGAKLQSEIYKFGQTELVIADSIHKYFAKTIAAAGLKGVLDKKGASVNEQQMYNEVFSNLFMEAVKKTSQKKFDVLVIDEGQDLLNGSYLTAISSILEGGIEKGEWIIFLDPGAQARLFNRFSKETYDYLRGLGVPEYKLDMNCRNTLQIAAQASIVSGFPTGRAKISGPEVEYYSYGDDEDQAFQIMKLIRRLITDENIPPECITILSTRTLSSMALIKSGLKLPPFIVEMNEINLTANEPGKLSFASVQAYKGLENNVIVYCDVDRIEDEWMEGVNYVGMTRAKEKLYVFLHKKLSQQYKARILEYASHQQKGIR